MNNNDYDNQEPNPMPVLSLNLGDVATKKLTDQIDIEMTVVGIGRSYDCGGISVIFSGRMIESIIPGKKYSANEGADLMGVVHTCPVDGKQLITLNTIAGTRATTESEASVGQDRMWVDWQEMVNDLPPIISEREYARQAMMAFFSDLLGDKL